MTMDPGTATIGPVSSANPTTGLASETATGLAGACYASEKSKATFLAPGTPDAAWLAGRAKAEADYLASVARYAKHAQIAALPPLWRAFMPNSGLPSDLVNALKAFNESLGDPDSTVTVSPELAQRYAYDEAIPSDVRTGLHAFFDDPIAMRAAEVAAIEAMGYGPKKTQLALMNVPAITDDRPNWTDAKWSEHAIAANVGKQNDLAREANKLAPIIAYITANAVATVDGKTGTLS